jgi:hypothetical protein
MIIVVAVIALTVAWTPLFGITKSYFKTTRNRLSLSSLVQIHHIIPRQFRKHPVISGFDIEDGSNYMFMPNKRGKSKLSTRRLNHEGGHKAYNKFVGAKLDEIYQQNNNPEQRIHKLINLTKYLRIQIMNGCEAIPWK